MADNDKDTPDIYPIRGLSVPPEATITPAENSDIFAIKKENVDRLDSLISIVLGAGVFLCNAYRLDKRVSRDERGEIWKASDIQASRNVTVFLPPLEIRKDESASEPVRQAAKHVEALDHPRIVPVLDTFADPEHGFFTVRKFVDGKTLDVYREEYVHRHGKLTPVRVTKILNDMAHALDYAHGVDIIHGDLCPKNIIVGLDDEVYLDNFLLVPVQAVNSSAERQPYQSPEVAEGLSAVAQSDVYALAAIAYELLSGRLPYSPNTMDTPLPIPHVPSTVDAVIRKAMSILPDDRYDSCGEFAKALEASFQEPQKVKPVAVLPPSKKSSVKKDLAATLYYSGMLLAFLAVFCIAAGSFVYFEYVKSAWLNIRQKQVTEQPVEMPPEPVALSPDPITLPPDPIALSPEPIALSPEPIAPPPEPIAPPPDPIAPPPDPIVPPPDPTVTLPEPPMTSVEQRERASHILSAKLHTEGERKIISINGIKHDFRWCTAGYFADGFWIQETAVTQETWKTVMGPNSMRDQFREGVWLPVRRVAWNECLKFIDELNRQDILIRAELEGYRFALPTEAQWEHAYRMKILVTDENMSEWCDNWYDEEEQYRVVRGGGGDRNRRAPEVTLGYGEVGFRLIIVPKEE